MFSIFDQSDKEEALERQFERFTQANTILKSRDLGSIICDIKFSELTYLDAFWRDYVNGSLLEALKGVFITGTEIFTFKTLMMFLYSNADMNPRPFKNQGQIWAEIKIVVIFFYGFEGRVNFSLYKFSFYHFVSYFCYTIIRKLLRKLMFAIRHNRFFIKVLVVWWCLCARDEGSADMQML